MTNTSLFLPEEHIVLADWLKVDALEKLEIKISVKEALSRLGLDRETSVYSVEDAAVASIILERIQGYLPQWACVRADTVTLAREIKERAANRTIELLPKALFTINWADSGPGFSWPVAYYATYVPLYDVYVVTASADSPDAFLVCDMALGHFKASDDIVEASLQIIKADWKSQNDQWDQQRWAYLFDWNLVSDKQAYKIADEVWEEELEEDYDEAI